MYIVDRYQDDGHEWKLCSKDSQPKFAKKYFCIHCGAKAYRITKADGTKTDMLSLTGEYYDGKILSCPIKVESAKVFRRVPTMRRVKKETTMRRIKIVTKLKRVKK